MEIDTVPVDGANIRFAYQPGAGTPIVLFNGIGSSLEVFEPIFKALPDRALVTFDLPGIGASEARGVPMSMRGFAVKAVAIMEAIGERLPWSLDAWDVLGLSWGGALAQELALYCPQRLNRLVLVSTSPGVLSFPPSADVLATMLHPYRHIDADYLASVAPRLYGGLARTHPQLIREHAYSLKSPSQKGYMHQLWAISSWTSLFRLKQIRVPTLVVCGTDDPVIPVGNAEFLANHIPDAQLTRIDGGGHLCAVLQAQRVVPVVEAFVDDESAHQRRVETL